LQYNDIRSSRRQYFQNMGFAAETAIFDVVGQDSQAHLNHFSLSSSRMHSRM
jgi:hypothetical protein